MSLQLLPALLLCTATALAAEPVPCSDPTDRIAAALGSELAVWNVGSVEHLEEDCWVRFSYKSSTDWPYGTGVAVWNPAKSGLSWMSRVDGDFGIHSLAWRDLNGDDELDLYFLSGEEDVLETYLFLAKAGKARKLRRAYSHENAYASLLDLDGDGKAEVLDPGPDGVGGCMDCEPVCVLPDGSLPEVRSGYRRIAGGFGAMNFDYGSRPELVGPSQLFVYDPVRIYRLTATGARVATGDFGEHLRWRLALLEQVRGKSGPKCDQRIAEVREYLERLLGRSAELS